MVGRLKLSLVVATTTTLFAPTVSAAAVQASTLAPSNTNAIDKSPWSRRQTKSSSSSRRRSSSSSRNNKTPPSPLRPDDFLVRGLEQVVPAFGEFQGLMYAGLLPTIATTTTPASQDDSTTSPSLMFWLFAPDEPVYTDTLVIWMNGGPGCSSLGGAMFEQGPVTIPLVPAGVNSVSDDATVDTDDETTTTTRPPPLSQLLHVNPYAWTRTTAILYLEQPVGTGFSSLLNDDATNNNSDHPFVVRNETDVSRDVYGFLQNLYTVFGTEWSSKRLYLFGESYAGMYVPSIAHYIHQQNKALAHANDNDPLKPTPLAGIAMGNGWMNALIQGPAVIDYAWWHGMIDSSTKTALHQEWDNCKSTAHDTDDDDRHHRRHHPYEPKPFHRFTVPDECGILGAVLSAAGANVVSWGGPNAYDVSTWDDYLMLDDPNGAIHRFYNNPVVQKALNIPNPPVSWVECMPGAGRRRKLQQEAPPQPAQQRTMRQQHHHAAKHLLPGQLLLDHDRPISVIPYVAELLDTGNIRVLVYNGDRDMTTNAQGSEMLLDAMKWQGADGWANKYERGLWLPGAHPTPQSYANIPRHTFGGYVKQYQNLEFLIVYNSGHLVPYNQDRVALDLVTRYLGNQSFLDRPLPRFEVEPKPRKTPTKHDALQESAINADDDDLRSAPPLALATTSVKNKRQNVTGKSTNWSNVVWSVIFIGGGFLSGLVASRWTNTRRRDYEVIPGHDKG